MNDELTMRGHRMMTAEDIYGRKFWYEAKTSRCPLTGKFQGRVSGFWAYRYAFSPRSRYVRKGVYGPLFWPAWEVGGLW